MAGPSLDPVALTADLVRCASVTPAEGGALILLQRVLQEAGFDCARVDRNGTANLFARFGPKGHARSFGFNGHTDVVPIGAEQDWSYPPFGAVIEGDWLYGRGATDMKSGVAAFVAAAVDFVTTTPPDGAIILAITGDEEGPATDGTVALLDWMADAGEAMSVCLVGEPTCPATLGDMIKIGRRGSLNAEITVTGKQGHVAYPHKALNPMPAMAALADRLSRHSLDAGTAHFDPSSLQITAIETGNPASNVIPARSEMRLNIRFNDLHSGASLDAWLQRECAEVAAEHGVQIACETRISGEAFLTEPGAFSDLIAAAVTQQTGLQPVLSTTGGTSDARFIQRHCPVVEFGLVGHRMHEVDERVSCQDIQDLTLIYSDILRRYFED
ncbi:succinyl-diaminopimelate desuccinylase [Rhodobacteraceae bacterium XHP0102]|nr:succinyl-diaminopimelate desuccinylase [Rhodobacteraceae bacterium XHP0102]